jgi:hypothetical protein
MGSQSGRRWLKRKRGVVDEDSVMKKHGDVSHWHSYSLVKKEDGRKVWRCRKCGREEPYTVIGLKPQSNYNLPCKSPGVK